MKLKNHISLNSELEQKIYHLDKLLNDAIIRFSVMSKIAELNDLKLFYKKKTEERKVFKKEINMFIEKFNLRPSKTGSVSGAFARFHAKVKTIFGSDPNEVSLNKALYHDESLLQEYERVLSKLKILPVDLIEVLQKQKEQIEKDIGKLKQLKNQ